MQQSRDVAAEMLSRIRRLTVIFNPAAGRGQAAKMRYEMESYMSRAVRNLHDIVSWRVVETTGPGHAQELAREAACNGVNIIVAAGGDGTICEVLNGMIGYESKLGVIPMGTGNDFARTLGSGLTIKEAVLSIFYGDPVRVDVGKINDRVFLNVAGCGFDAIIAEKINSGSGRLKGRTAYVAAVYQSLKDFEAIDIELTLDDETRSMKAILCAVANARSYGGGMKVTPDALLNDGLLDVCVVNTGKWEFVKAFPRVFKGTHTNHPDVLMAQARRVKIVTAKPMPVLVDGENYGTTPAEFTIVPLAVTVQGPERLPGVDSRQFGYVDTSERDW